MEGRGKTEGSWTRVARKMIVEWLADMICAAVFLALITLMWFLVCWGFGIEFLFTQAVGVWAACHIVSFALRRIEL